MQSGAIAARTLVGRERELHLLDALARTVHSGGGAAVVRGEAGIGKSALLDRVAGGSSARTLWVRGTEAEAVLPFAAVADLLLPLRAHFDQLPGVQREALEVSLALRAGDPVGPLAVCAATLGVLTAAGEREPLLVLVDDLQWVDPSSQQVLLFVARRLASEQVVMLFAVRDRPGHEDVPPGIATLELGGLSDADSRALVAGQGVDVCRLVLDKIVEHAGGNPLALLETTATTPAEVLSGKLPYAAEPALGPSLHRAWGTVVDELSEATRTGLFVIAVSRTAGVGEIEPVLDALGGSLADLGPAERSGLVRVRERKLLLRHPLLRSVVYDRTPLATRLRVHRAFANSTEGDLRVWHLAASATGPDELIADGLAGAARSARKRGAYRTSARIWGRAAELTPDPQRRADRLLASATDAHIAGQAAIACGSCDEALALRSDPLFAADVELVRGRAVTSMGHPLRALEEMVRAGDAVLAHDRSRAARLYAEAVLPAALVNRVNDMLGAALRSQRLLASTGEQAPQSVAVTVAAHILSGSPDEARRCLGHQLSASAHPAWDVQHLAMLAQCRMWLEAYGPASSELDAILDDARRRGASWIIGFALTVRSELAWWTGHWAAARADAAEALRWGEELEQTVMTAFALVALARLDASRGDVATCRERMDRALREAGPYGLACTSIHVPGVLGLAALGVGELGEAVEHLEQAWSAAVKGGMSAPTVVPFAGDLVEAHIRAGNAARAAEVLAWLDERAAGGDLIFPAAAAARCRGLLCDDLDPARRSFDEAARLHQRHPVPFERARTLLCHGEVLRRLRRPAAARPLLREALAVFDRLGARPWAARAETELAATGVHRGPRTDTEPLGLDTLTPQELQIARVVADGLNNAEAAAVLYLSRKTVEAHLTRVYRKLGLRSRLDLARVFAPMQARADALPLSDDHGARRQPEQISG